jgi:hypothetical protein
MPAGEYNAYIEQGANWLLTLTLTDSDGEALDLTNYTGAAQIRETTISATVLATPTVTFAIPRSSGVVSLSLTAEQTAAITTTGVSWQKTSNYIWEFYLTATDGTVIRVLNGFANVSPGGIQS